MPLTPTNTLSHAGGTGLGLYSLFKRVEALGGDCGVKARSDGNPGSAFWFSFPYRPDPTAIVPSSNRRESRNRNLAIVSLLDQSASDSGRMSLPLRNGTMSVSGAVRTESLPTDLPNDDNDGIEVWHASRPADDRVTPDSNPPSNNISAISPLLMINVLPVSEQSNPPSVLQTPMPNDDSLRVLLTDDAPTILKVCKRMLRTNGHAVLTAVNGQQSLEKLKTYYANDECDVLLTDLQMPVMDGIECTKRFRVWEETQQCLLDAQGLPRRPRFLIVGMSANSDAQSKQEALDAGDYTYTSSPSQ